VGCDFVASVEKFVYQSIVCSIQTCRVASSWFVRHEKAHTDDTACINVCQIILKFPIREMNILPLGLVLFPSIFWYVGYIHSNSRHRKTWEILFAEFPSDSIPLEGLCSCINSLVTRISVLPVSVTSQRVTSQCYQSACYQSVLPHASAHLQSEMA
jgi:hypothetical protein